MHDLWGEFAKVALAHLLAVASPGPDFAVVLRQSFEHGRRVAVWTAIGIGTGIMLHVGYSLLGLGQLLRGAAVWFTVVKYLGAAYMAWLGIQSLRAAPRRDVALDGDERVTAPNGRSAFATGFFTNALNPKVSLFFIALFAVVVSPSTPKRVQAGYGLWMVLATMAWFSLVAVVFTRARVREAFLRHGHWIDRALGVVFLAFALGLAVADVT
jgi:RhtB (resistance to homoserine/threonine) family protein